MVLSIGSLICLLFVFTAGLTKNDQTLHSLYYIKTDTKNFTSTPEVLGGQSTTLGSLLGTLMGSASTNKLYDFYEIYLWNYCVGSTTNAVDTVQACTSRNFNFVFNPLQVWGLNGTTVQNEIPGAINSAISAYTKGAHFMHIAYTIAFWTTVGTIVAGLFAICSRVGSCITTIVSGFATLFTILSALASTIIFSTLTAALNGSLKEYNIVTHLGTKMLAIDWLAAAFSIAASLFWFISICCCSGRSGRKERRSTAAPATGSGFAPFGNRGYQPIADDGVQHPSMYGQQPGNRGMEMQDFGAGPYKGRDTAYEPFRHGGV